MLRDMFAKAHVYSFLWLIGATRGRQLCPQRHIRPRVDDRVFDIGCGSSDILEALPSVDYHGFDLSADYIESARKRFGTRGQFHVEMVTTELVPFVTTDLLRTPYTHLVLECQRNTEANISQTSPAKTTSWIRATSNRVSPIGARKQRGLIGLRACLSEGLSA